VSGLFREGLVEALERSRLRCCDLDAQAGLLELAMPQRPGTEEPLEGLFADELALLQPAPGYMRLLKEPVLQIWKARKAAVRDEIATAQRAAKAIQEKLNALVRIERPPLASSKKLDVEGDQRQRFQQVFFPDGISFDGNRFVGTGVTAPAYTCGKSEPEMKVWWTRPGSNR
jgi:hypothetical protein